MGAVVLDHGRRVVGIVASTRLTCAKSVTFEVLLVVLSSGVLPLRYNEIARLPWLLGLGLGRLPVGDVG